MDQYVECLRKNNITYWRSPTYNMNSRLVMTIIIALVLGTLYLNQGQKVSTFMKARGATLVLLPGYWILMRARKRE